MLLWDAAGAVWWLMISCAPRAEMADLAAVHLDVMLAAAVHLDIMLAAAEHGGQPVGIRIADSLPCMRLLPYLSMYGNNTHRTYVVLHTSSCMPRRAGYLSTNPPWRFILPDDF